MKKTLKTGKKILSVVMAALLLVTAGVFFAPEKARAAKAGNYTIKVIVTCTNGFNNKDTSWNLTYKKNNGTGEEARDSGSIGNKADMFKTTWNGTDGNTVTTLFERSYSGFPTYFEIKGYKSTWTGDGKFKIDVYVNGNWVGNGETKFSGNVHFACGVHNIGNYPYPNRVTWSWNDNQKKLTVPKSGAETVQSNSATVYDQYGVEWYQEPSYAYGATNEARNSSDTSIHGVDLSSADGNDTLKLGISNSIKDWVSNNGTGFERTLYVNAYCGNAKSNVVPIKITNCTYMATFYDRYNGKDKYVGEYSCYYNYGTPEEPHMETVRDKDESRHYLFDGWEPALAPIKKDTPFYSKYKAEEHKWKETGRTESSCTVNGSIFYECEVCGYTKTEERPLAPHKYVLEKITEPTCTEKGYSYGHCSVCGQDGNYDFVPALGHDMKLSENGTTAKCESGGTAVYVCDREGCGYIERRQVERLGHDYSNIYQSPEATCTQDGREYHKCIRCESFDVDFGGRNGVVVPKLGHDYGEWVITTPETCETDGEEVRTCSHNASHTEKRIRPRTGHEYDESVTLRIEPTCVKDGLVYHPCKHEGCNAKETVEVLSALGHDSDNATWKVTVAAKCEQKGREDLICGREGCGESLANREIPVLGHEWGEYTKTKDATCTENAKQTASCVHEDCTKTNTIDIENTMLGHDFTDYKYNGDEACEKNGTETGKCSRCGFENTREVPGTALSHVYDKKIKVRVEKEATCTEDEVIIIVCDRCMKAEKEYTVLNTKLGHNVLEWIHDEDTETCCDYGTKHGTCLRCGETDVAVDKGVLKPHVFGEYVSDGNATCQKDGTKTARCVNFCHNGKSDGSDAVQCEATYTVRDYGSRLEHNFPDPVTESELYVSNNDGTCLRDGTKTATCKNEGCSAKKTVPDPGSTRPHKYVTWISDSNATCTTDGTKHAYCMYGCGTVTENVPDEGSALGHHFRNWDYSYNNDATCTKDGTRTAQCENEFPTGEFDEDGNPIMARCTEKSTLPAPETATGHKWSEWSAVGEEASCTNGGKFERHCENEFKIPVRDEDGNIVSYKTVTCDAKEEKTVEPFAHSYKWEILPGDDGDEANCNAGYYKIRKCEFCGYVDEASKVHVEGKAHHFVAEIQDATCTEDGKRIVYCDVCNNESVRSEEIIPATGHINTELDKDSVIPATCAEKGFSGNTVCIACGAIVTPGTETEKTNNHVFTTYTKISDATCAENAKEEAVCDVCAEATNIREVAHSALGHEYDKNDYTVKTAATCTGDEVREYRCVHTFKNADGDDVRCENTKEETVRNSALGHRWGEWTVVEKATCTKAGKAERKCLNDGCDVIITKPLRKLSHVESDWIIDKEASCTETGKRHKECTNGCGYIYEEEVIPMKEHNFEVTECTATCIDDGFSTYVCTVCSTERKGSIVHALGHDWSGEWVVTKNPTCTKKGIETLTCTRCDKTKTREIDALGHGVVVDPAVPATCTKDGLSEGSHCDRCGKVLKKQETVVKPHYDGDNDGKCDMCGKEIKHSTDLNCNCICHKQFPLMKFKYKILLFFWKLFKIGKGCACGATHY